MTAADEAASYQELTEAAKAAMRYLNLNEDVAASLPPEVAARLQAAEQEQHDAAALPTGSCPAWCREGEGHVFSAAGDGVGERLHEAPLDRFEQGTQSFALQLEQAETVDATGAVSRGLATVSVQADLDQDDPAILRLMARRLVEAAEALERAQNVR